MPACWSFEVREVNGKTIIFDAGHNPHGVEFC